MFIEQPIEFQAIEMKMRPANSFEPSQVSYSWIRPACNTSFSNIKTFLFDEIGEGGSR